MENKALLYSERYGITDYKVRNNIMTYYEYHKDMVGEKPNKYRYDVNLNTMETKVKKLYDRK